MPEIAPSAPRPTVAVAPGSSFVEWGAVFAGGAMAAALSFVLITFGSAIGLSFVSPWAGAGTSPKVIASLAVFWTITQQIGAAMAGGYVAGRMRSRWGEATVHEVEFRDGLHGGLVWAVGVIISVVVLASAAGVVARIGADAAGRAASVASNDPLAYQADMLLRPTGTGAAPASTPAALTTQNADQRGEVVRIMARSIVVGGLSEPDRQYLASVVSQRTGLSQADAEKRVSDAYGAAARTAKEAADKARHAAILTGFVTAASLLLALGAAWWAALRGGHHRDNAIPARFFMTVIPAPRRSS
jgi:hypothetical protein